MVRELLVQVDHNLGQMSAKERRDSGFQQIPGPAYKKRPGPQPGGSASSTMRIN